MLWLCHRFLPLSGTSSSSSRTLLLTFEEHSPVINTKAVAANDVEDVNKAILSFVLLLVLRSLCLRKLTTAGPCNSTALLQREREREGEIRLIQLMAFELN